MRTSANIFSDQSTPTKSKMSTKKSQMNQFAALPLTRLQRVMMNRLNWFFIFYFKIAAHDGSCEWNGVSIKHAFKRVRNRAEDLFFWFWFICSFCLSISYVVFVVRQLYTFDSLNCCLWDIFVVIGSIWFTEWRGKSACEQTNEIQTK